MQFNGGGGVGCSGGDNGDGLLSRSCKTWAAVLQSIATDAAEATQVN